MAAAMTTAAVVSYWKKEAIPARPNRFVRVKAEEEDDRGFEETVKHEHIK